MRTLRVFGLAALLSVTIASSNGCLESRTSDGPGAGSPSGLFGLVSRPAVPEGTPLQIRLTSGISSETARAGDEWTGVVVNAVTVRGKEVVPAGSSVHGLVTSSLQARRGSRAMLDLDVQSVSLDGKDVGVHAVTEPVIAGSPRARNLGAIAGGVAAGALIGNAVGGDAAVGGLLGGAAAGALVAASKGYQVVLKPGTVMNFTVTPRT